MTTMKTSVDIDLIATALAAAQGEMPAALFNRTNPHFRSQYADLSSIRDASLPALSKHGLAIVQTPTLVTTELPGEPPVTSFVLYSRLIHKSGQWFEADWPLRGATPQALGSELSYAKRYTWSALIGLAADDDDDAEVAEYSQDKDIKPSSGKKKSAHRAHKDADWPTLQAEMDAICNDENRTRAERAHALTVWGTANHGRLHSLPDNWLVHAREDFQRRIVELREGVTETGEIIDDEVPESGGSAT